MRRLAVVMSVALLVGAPRAAQAAAPLQSQPSEAALPLVASTAPDRELDCLATAISYEAGSEPEAGQEAVAQVVVNRLHDPAFPKTVCGVVYQGWERRTGCQFSFTCDGSLARWRPTRSVANARRIAALALAGALSSPVGAATFYHAYYVAPAWAARMERVVRIGAHIFYRPLATAFDAARQQLAETALDAGPARAAPVETTLSVWGLKAATLTAVGDRIQVRRP